VSTSAAQRARFIAVAVTVGVLAACDGGEATPPTSQAATTTAPVTAASLVVDNVTGYFDALAQRAASPSGAAPVSDAALFAQHQASVQGLLAESASTRSATSVPTGIDVCDPAGGCVSYSDITTDADGLVTTFSVDGQPLAGRVVGAGVPDEHDGVSVRVISAYQTTEGDLLVVLEVTSRTDVDIELFGFAAVLESLDVDVGAVEASGVWGTTSVAAFASGRQLIAFPASAPVGHVLLSGLRSDGVDVAFDIHLPDLR
jgi:hypothetical protein